MWKRTLTVWNHAFFRLENQRHIMRLFPFFCTGQRLRLSGGSVMHSIPHQMNSLLRISSTVALKSGSPAICFSIFFTEWMMVEWSLPPNFSPISG